MDEQVESLAALSSRAFVGGQQSEEAGEKDHGEVDGVRRGRSVDDLLDEHDAEGMIVNGQELGELGSELGGAQIADESTAEPSLCGQHGIHDRQEHRKEVTSFTRFGSGGERNVVLFEDEQFSQYGVLAREVDVERSSRHADPLGDHRDLGGTEAALAELLDGFLEEPGSRGIALGRTAGDLASVGGSLDSRSAAHVANTNARH